MALLELLVKFDRCLTMDYFASRLSTFSGGQLQGIRLPLDQRSAVKNVQRYESRFQPSHLVTHNHL